MGTAFFLGWDVWAIALGIFLHRESPLMTGIMIGAQLPLEEAFFLLFLCYQTMIVFTGALAFLQRGRLRSHGSLRSHGRQHGSGQPNGQPEEQNGVKKQ